MVKHETEHREGEKENCGNLQNCLNYTDESMMKAVFVVKWSVAVIFIVKMK